MFKSVDLNDKDKVSDFSVQMENDPVEVSMTAMGGERVTRKTGCWKSIALFDLNLELYSGSYRQKCQLEFFRPSEIDTHCPEDRHDKLSPSS